MKAFWVSAGTVLQKCLLYNTCSSVFLPLKLLVVGRFPTFLFFGQTVCPKIAYHHKSQTRVTTVSKIFCFGLLGFLVSGQAECGVAKRSDTTRDTDARVCRRVCQAQSHSESTADFCKAPPSCLRVSVPCARMTRCRLAGRGVQPQLWQRCLPRYAWRRRRRSCAIRVSFGVTLCRPWRSWACCLPAFFFAGMPQRAVVRQRRDASLHIHSPLTFVRLVVTWAMVRLQGAGVMRGCWTIKVSLMDVPECERSVCQTVPIGLDSVSPTPLATLQSTTTQFSQGSTAGSTLTEIAHSAAVPTHTALPQRHAQPHFHHLGGMRTHLPGHSHSLHVPTCTLNPNQHSS